MLTNMNKLCFLLLKHKGISNLVKVLLFQITNSFVNLKVMSQINMWRSLHLVNTPKINITTIKPFIFVGFKFSLLT